MQTQELTATQHIIAQEKQYGAHNYSPLPVVLSRGEGVNVWDVEGNHYYDFLSAYSAVNQGHCHPKIIAALVEQAQKITLTSRAFYNDCLGPAEEYICKYFGYDKALFMNSGAEAVETAIKMVRKWAYVKKGIPTDMAKILVVSQNFHGRTTGIISFSSDPDSTTGFGPMMPGFITIPYNDIQALADALAANPDICGFLVEPIQGEAGVVVPDEGYLKKAHELCKQHQVMLMADEIQTGIGRTGKLLASHYDEVHADILILGKALSGGVLPVSAVLSADDIMLCIKPGEHGSTFGGNPMAAVVSIAGLKVIKEEGLTENAFTMGNLFRERILHLKNERPDLIQAVRGRGLLNAIQIIPSNVHGTAGEVCLALMKKGLLSKPTQKHTIRFSPPLVINESQVQECCDRIEEVILNF
jgi:ornithine--oxo-acid transaminase